MNKKKVGGQGNKKRSVKSRPPAGQRTPANDMQTAVKAFMDGYGRAVTGRTGTPKIK